MTTQSIERRKASVYEGSMHQRPISEGWPEIGQHKGTKDSTTDKRSRDGAQGNEAALGTLAGGVGLIKLARTQQIVGPPERFPEAQHGSIDSVLVGMPRERPLGF
jgi:hypothetical protein